MMTWRCSYCGYTENQDEALRCSCGADIVVSDTCDKSMKRPLGLTILAGIFCVSGFYSLISAMTGTNSTPVIKFIDLILCFFAFATAAALLSMHKSAKTFLLFYSLFTICAALYYHFVSTNTHSGSNFVFTMVLIFTVVALLITYIYLNKKLNEYAIGPNNSQERTE